MPSGNRRGIPSGVLGAASAGGEATAGVLGAATCSLLTTTAPTAGEAGAGGEAGGVGY